MTRNPQDLFILANRLQVWTMMNASCVTDNSDKLPGYRIYTVFTQSTARTPPSDVPLALQAKQQ